MVHVCVRAHTHTLLLCSLLQSILIETIRHLLQKCKKILIQFITSQLKLCTSWKVLILQDRGLLPAPKSGLLSNTRKWIVQGDTDADEASDFIEKGGEQEDEGSQEGCSVSGFMVMGLVSRLPLASHSGSRSFLMVHTLLSQDGFQQGDFWEIGRTYGISFWPLPILPVGVGLLVPCSLPGSPVIK